jgi:hypothetical protein
MKSTVLKKLIKEAVKEAIQEELKDVLLEAVRAPKQVVNETKLGTPSTNVAAPISSPSSVSLAEQKKKYMDVIGETALSFTSKDAKGFGNKPFNPQGTIDTTSPNGALPAGEVGMDQIMGLMTNK